MHVHLSSLEPTELVNGLASLVAAAEISCCVTPFKSLSILKFFPISS